MFASPLSCLIVNGWLQSFAYRVDLYWWVFLLSLIAVIAVALSVVTFTAWRVVNRNPIDVLGKGD